MIIEEEVYLNHFGTRGMKWGVRKTQNLTSNEKSNKMSTKKKAAIILGSAAAVTAIGVGAFYAKKHFNIKVSDIQKPNQSVTKFATSMAKEPVGIVHASRGRNRGFTFPQRGGLNDPLKEYISSGLDKTTDQSAGFFKRYGNENEKVAAMFLDPLGRKDRAGRTIPHAVMLPKDMAKNVNNIDDVIKVSWPHIKDVFGALYQAEPETLGPGY